MPLREVLSHLDPGSWVSRHSIWMAMGAEGAYPHVTLAGFREEATGLHRSGLHRLTHTPPRPSNASLGCVLHKPTGGPSLLRRPREGNGSGPCFLHADHAALTIVHPAPRLQTVSYTLSAQRPHEHGSTHDPTHASTGARARAHSHRGRGIQGSRMPRLSPPRLRERESGATCFT